MGVLLDDVDFDLVSSIGGAMLSAARSKLGITEPTNNLVFGSVDSKTLASLYAAAVGLQAFFMSDIRKELRDDVLLDTDAIFYSFLDDYDEGIDGLTTPVNDR